MPLADQINALATRVGVEVKARVLKSITVTADHPAGPGFWQYLWVNYAPGTQGPEPFLVDCSSSGTKYRVFWLNENGVLRVAASRANEVAVKIHGYQGTGGTPVGIHLTEWWTSWATPTVKRLLYAIGSDGKPKIGKLDPNASPMFVTGAHTIIMPVGTTQADVAALGIPAETVIVIKSA